ncbi:MAG: hypothetical protein RL518_2046 [Pseudomonadota bacterium]
MRNQANTTTDHDEIQNWIEQRGGVPSIVRATHERAGSGILRVDFPEEEPDEGLEEIGWDEFFKIFDRNKLAFLHQDQTASGQESRFCKFVART